MTKKIITTILTISFMLFGFGLSSVYANNNVMCTMQYDPVCGVDGKTYSNECVATQQNGVEVDYKGECKKTSEKEDNQKLKIHWTWDINKDGINDCEDEGICGHTVDYTKPRTFDNKKDFLETQGQYCAVATDGCNTVQIKDGKAGAMTRMYCEDIYGENGQEKWSCKKHIDDVKETSEKEETTQENIAMCTMEYNPVCGVDGKTYSNQCVATQQNDVKIAYNGKCREVVSPSEIKNVGLGVKNKVRRILNQAFGKIFEKEEFNKNGNKINYLNNVISKTENLLNKEEAKKYQHILLYIKYYIQDYKNENIYENYLKENISKISPKDAVLGGTWYTTNIEWINKNTAKVDYEDGHIAESIKVKLKTKNGDIKTNIIQ